MAQVQTQAGVTSEFLLNKATFFRDVGLWPRSDVLSPERWLTNFREDELAFAVHLLNAFQFFSQDLTDQLFVAAFHGISADMWARHGSGTSAAWGSFFDRALVTPVEGERPNPTDSGYAFARRARQLLDIDERRIMRPQQAVFSLLAASSPVVFVDDFVGSGNQFLETWHRVYRVGTTAVSFDAIAKVRGGEFYYCPLICTDYGAERIRKHCPDVVLLPAHTIGAGDGALHESSRVWPSDMRPHAVEFIRRASARAGIPEAGEKGWQGFHGLGLALAFAHSVPDATLPLFYWERNGWNPLLRRT